MEKNVHKMMREAIRKEETMWKPLELSKCDTKGGAAVTFEHRSDILEWLWQVSVKFQFYPEALSLAASVLDKFLSCVKVQTKYLKCVALACLLIGSKMTEEDEVVPHIADFVTQTSANCSTDDVVRMERLILNKLEWNVNMATPLHFLQMCHCLLLSEKPDLLATVRLSAENQMELLTRKLRLCMMSAEYCHWSPSLLAVSLLSLELEQFRQDWFPLTLLLLKFIQKSNFSELISCRESLSSHFVNLMHEHQAEQRALAEQQNQSEPLESCRQHKRTRHHTNVRSKRKMTEPPLDQDDIYSSIKVLYAEEDVGEERESATDITAKLSNED